MTLSHVRRLYVWSVVLEPLLFFVLFQPAVSGVSLSAGRILQVVVLIALAVVLWGRISRPGPGVRLPFPAWSVPTYRYYAMYFALAVAAGTLGIASGAYSVEGLSGTVDMSDGLLVLNSPAVRSAFEYVIALYYFLYFAVLPQYLLRTERQVAYALSTFRRMFIVSFTIGVIAFGAAALGFDFLPRHIADWRLIGVRFHGLAGEPRSAFVYLFLGLAMLHLYAFYRGRMLNKWWIPAIILAALFTQTASGLLGIGFFVGLYALYSLRDISLRRSVTLVVVIAVTGVTLYGAVVNSGRLMVFVDNSAAVWTAFQQDTLVMDNLPPIMVPHRDNLVPMYGLFDKLRDGDYLPVLVGSGLGSASVITNRLADSGVIEVTNPNSQLVRMLYESGIVGSSLFIMAFAYPVSRHTRHLPLRTRRQFMVLMLLVVGCCLGTRSSAMFAYLGAFVATFRVMAAGAPDAAAEGGDQMYVEERAFGQSVVLDDTHDFALSGTVAATEDLH